MAAHSTFWSMQVETADGARKMIRESAQAFYAVAAIQTVVAFFLGRSMLVDAAVYAGLGFWLQRGHSRVAATLLLLAATIGIATTAMNQFGGGQGSRNVVLAIIVLWAAVRAVIATYKLSRLTQQERSPVAPGR